MGEKKHTHKKGTMGLTLHVEVRDAEGKLIQEGTVEKDLVTYNLAKWFRLIFQQTLGHMIDVDGLHQSVSWILPDAKPTLRIGDDDTEPTRDDYHLGNYISGTGDITTTIKFDQSGLDLVIIDGTIENGGGVTWNIKEVCLLFTLVAIGIGQKGFMMARDLYNASVPPGGTINFGYEFSIAY